ncbi:MAG: hypothetical protein ACRD1R_03670 [Acidobacteriota bacterium]
MSASAWVMLGITWAIIFFFTGRFFLRVLRSPNLDREEDEASD